MRAGWGRVPAARAIARWFRRTEPEGTYPGRRASPPTTPPGVRVYAIGDVHGRLDLLDQKLALIDADLKSRPVERGITVLLGDYVGRGPDSAGVLARLRERSSRADEAVFLLGNHEAWLLGSLRDPALLAAWLPHGGREAVLSYGVIPPAGSAPPERIEAAAEQLRRSLPPEDAAFLAALPECFSCGDFFFAHAGVRPGIPLEEQSSDDLLWIREEFLNSEADFGKVVVHGHTPVRVPEIRFNRICIDTGGYMTGLLTCIVLDETGAPRFL